VGVVETGTSWLPTSWAETLQLHVQGLQGGQMLLARELCLLIVA
jgi:hypothetical protein